MDDRIGTDRSGYGYLLTYSHDSRRKMEAPMHQCGAAVYHGLKS